MCDRVTLVYKGKSEALMIQESLEFAWTLVRPNAARTGIEEGLGSSLARKRKELSVELRYGKL